MRSVRRRRARFCRERWHIVIEGIEEVIYVGMVELAEEERWL